MQLTISISPTKQGDTLIADLRALRQKILARRGGRPAEIGIIEQVCEERDHELTGLH